MQISIDITLKPIETRDSSRSKNPAITTIFNLSVWTSNLPVCVAYDKAPISRRRQGLYWITIWLGIVVFPIPRYDAQTCTWQPQKTSASGWAFCGLQGFIKIDPIV